MDLIDREDLRDLAGFRGKACVSIYIPTHRAGAEIQEDPIRLKNMLSLAEERIISSGLRPPQARDILKEARRLVKDGLFWHYQSDGLAVFSSSESFRFYRLPVRFAEKCVVSDRFFIKPLLPVLGATGRFYVIAISQKGVRLFGGSRFGLGEMNLGDMPVQAREIIRTQKEARQLQFHSGAGEKTVGGFERVAIFHGHGSGKELKKERILRYFTAIDRFLREYLRDRSSPVILCGVDYLLPIYREASSLGTILSEAIQGNPEKMETQEMHHRALAIVEKEFERPKIEALERYRSLAGTGHTSKEISEIVPMAHRGHIETLFVDVESEIWGGYDESNQRVMLHGEVGPDSEDLLDRCAVQTYFHHGSVFALPGRELPDGSKAAAILRF